MDFSSIYIPFKCLELMNDLSPSSRFTWLALQWLVGGSQTSSIASDVKGLSYKLNMSDKTLKTAIDELLSNKLLKRRKYKTRYGANSYKYFPQPIQIEHDADTDYCLRFHEDSVRQPQMPFGRKKLTVTQRLLLVVLESYSEGLGLVTGAHVNHLSKLTGIRKHNVVKNLETLQQLGFFTSICKPKREHFICLLYPHSRYLASLSQFARKVNQLDQTNYWAFNCKQKPHSCSSTLVLRNRNKSELIWASKIAFKLPNQEELDKLTNQPPSMPFIELCEKDRYFMIDTIKRNADAWREAELKLGIFHLDLMLFYMAVHLLSGYCQPTQSSNMPKNCIAEWHDTSNLAKILVRDLPISQQAAASLSMILVPLSELIANRLHTSLETFFEVKLDNIEFYLDAFEEDASITNPAKGSKNNVTVLSSNIHFLTGYNSDYFLNDKTSYSEDCDFFRAFRK